MITAEMLLIEIEAIISVWMGSYAFVLVSAVMKGFLSGIVREDDEDFERVFGSFLDERKLDYWLSYIEWFYEMNLKIFDWVLESL